MLFLLRIPGWLLWIVGFLLSCIVCPWLIIISFDLMISLGLIYVDSQPCWWVLFIMFAPAIIFWIFVIINEFVIDHYVEKWHSEGLRYAKCAKDNGLVNLAEKAAKCFLKCSIFRYDSVVNLGLCYAEGFGVEKDIVKAARCYKIAASRICIGRVALGFCYAEGLGVDKDMVKAEDWYKKANDALLKFRRIFLEYINLADGCWNQKEVIKWMRAAAEYGHAAIQIALSSCYENGWGVPKDDVEADRWFRKAAENGDAKAQYDLGCRYKSQNTAEAIKWFCMAADQGHRYAIEELEELKKVGSQD